MVTKVRSLELLSLVTMVTVVGWLFPPFLRSDSPPLNAPISHEVTTIMFLHIFLKRGYLPIPVPTNAVEEKHASMVVRSNDADSDELLENNTIPVKAVSLCPLSLLSSHTGLSEPVTTIEADSGTEVLSICRWNAVGQHFVCYTTVPIPIGDFAISDGNSYRIEVSTTIMWP